MKLLQNRRIFYIEDNHYNRAVVMTLLKRNGAKVAFDGWQGADTLKRVVNLMPVDMILLDLNLAHHVSGYAVYDAIRADERLKVVPVVVLSAADRSQELPIVYRKGMNGFISLPVDALDFPRLIASSFKRPGAWVAG